jgi:hypothetical protein
MKNKTMHLMSEQLLHLAAIEFEYHGQRYRRDTPATEIMWQTWTIITCLQQRMNWVTLMSQGMRLLLACCRSVG